MKNLLLFLIFFILSTNIIGQNLAPNPNFENTTASCADTVSELFTDYSQAQDWFGTACESCAGNGSTPDYYNSLCNGPSQTNNCGNSNGSLGFFTYAVAGLNSREYVQAQLLSTLVAGTEYCVSIDVKTSNGSSAYKPSDGFGLWFTDQMVDIDTQNGGQMFIGPGSMINATPQIENPQGNFIDTNCITFTGTFTATGTEQWVVIGNYRNDANTQFNASCSFFNPCFGYLIVDDLSVVANCNSTPLDLQLSLANDTICEGECTDLTANVTGGTAPFTITWDNGLPNGSGPHNVCPNTTTTYTAIVTDALNDADTTSITLTVNQIPSNTQNITLCQGDSIIVGSNTYNSTGNYVDTIFNAAANGCDSIVNTNLTINPNTSSTQNFTECQGFSITVGGNVYNTTGTYTDTLTAANGCDSIVTTDLTINPSSSFTQNFTECQGFSVTVGSSVYNTTGTYTDTLTAANSCDSIVTTNLTINPTVTHSQSFTECQGFSVTVGSNVYNTTGTYTDTLTAANSCDSIVTTNLTITSPSSTTNVYNECEGFSVTVDTNIYTTTGVYTDIVNGCDTIITDLTIIPSPTLTLIKEDDNCGENSGNVSALVNSSNPPITYNWSTGSTDSTISNLPSGTYTVTVNDDSGCSVTDSIDVFDLEIDCDYFVYLPNAFTPNGDQNNDVLYVRGKGIASFTLKIFNRWGNKVFETSDLGYGWDGLYKGEEQNTSVFVYTIEGEFENGETFIESGDVSLLR